MIPTQTWAGGFEGSGIGPKALSMGGSFVAVADDWSAAFWNPAGFAFQKGWGVGQSVDFLSLRAHDGNSLANPTPPITKQNIEQGDVFFQLGGEPTHFNTQDTTIQAALPSIVGYKCWDRWAFSIGFFSPLGYAFKLDDDSIPGYRAHFESQGVVVSYNFSGAYRLSDRWALGGGVNLLDARLKRESSKATPTYTQSGSSDGRGQTFQGVVGILGRVHEKITVGASYKTGSQMTLDGTANVAPGIAPFQNESSRVQSSLYNPAVYLAGLQIKPTPNFSWSAGWHGTDWTPTRVREQFDAQGVILQNQDFDARWRFTNGCQTGAEYRWGYRPDRQLAVRGGYTWDPSALPDEAVSVTNIVDVSRHVWTSGLAWQAGAWETTVGFAYAHGSRTIQQVEYKKVDRLLTVGVAYHTL